MAKYCMFCGEEIPEAAQFCPSCGQRQAATDSKKSTLAQNSNNSMLEEDDDEMDLLLKFGMMSGNAPKKVAPAKKEEPKEQKIITLDYKPEEISEEISEKVQIKEEPRDIVLNKKTEIDIKEVPEIIKEEEAKEEIKEVVENTAPDEEFDTTEEDVKEEASDLDTKNNIEEKEDDTSLSQNGIIDDDEDFDVVEDDPFDEVEDPDDDENDDNDDEDEKEEMPINRHAARRRDVSIRKRPIITDDEEEEEETFSTDMRDSSMNSMYNQHEMLADEKADYEKRKNAKVEPEEDEESTEPTQLEGRRQTVQKVEKKRQSKRNFDERKIYKIEQDKSELDENEDPEYDGYYENVLTIDHDQEKKSNVDVKSLALVGLLLSLAIGLVYFALTSL